MKRYVRVGLTRVGVYLGLAAIVVSLSTLAAAAATGVVDLSIRATVPNQVDVDSTYLLNVSYANEGWVQALDNWVRVTLPDGTQFVAATDADGDPRLPDEVDGRVLTWNVPLLVAHSGWVHMLVHVQTDEGLAEGTTLDVLVEIGSSAQDADLENNSVTVTSIAQDMGGSQKRVHVRNVMPADLLEYTITIDMPSDAGRQWVTMLDQLPSPALVRFMGWDGTPVGALLDGHRLRWEGWVDPGVPVELRYRLGVEGDVVPGTALMNQATLEWKGHREQLGPVTSVVEVPYGVLGVGPEQGGQLQHQCGATLTVPPDAVRESTRFELGPLNTELRPIEAPAGWQVAHRAFEVNAFRFGEPVRQFHAPLSIEVQFSEADVVGLKRETLRLWTREGPEGPWAMMGEPLRTAAGTLVHTTTHLSEFGLFGEPVAPGLVDLTVRATAPVQVVAGTSYVVNVSYANQGWIQAHDNWVRVTVPADAQFVGATYPGGEAHPPDGIDGRVLTWNVPLLVANSAWGHIMVEIEPDAGLADGTVLEVLAEIGGSEDDPDLENNTDTAISTINEAVADPPYRSYLPLVRVQ